MVMYFKMINTELQVHKWPAFPSKQRAEWLSPLSTFMKEHLDIDTQTSATVFNIASGTGHTSAKLEQLYPNFNICDFDIADIPESQQFKNFIQTDYHELPVGPKIADIIFCFFGLDYSLQPRTVVQEWHRVIKDKGRALITLHSPFSNIISRLNAQGLKDIGSILTTYDNNDLDLFYSRFRFFFGNIDFLNSLTNIEEIYNFLKIYYEISSFLFRRKDFLFTSPKQIAEYFNALGFKAHNIDLIQHDGSLVDPTEIADYAKIPHDGWLVALEK